MFNAYNRHNAFGTKGKLVCSAFVSRGFNSGTGEHGLSDVNAGFGFLFVSGFYLSFNSNPGFVRG